jgi:uncharacterized protein YcfJ
MKQSILLAALGLTAFGAAAQEIGNVISSVPVIQQVAVPRQVCSNQPVMVQQPTSGAGGIVGALVGGGIGSQIGSGGGTGAAIVLGTIAGAIIGNNAEAGNYPPQAQMVPQCTTQTSYENRTVAWNVTYEYAGRQYAVQMPYDPGPTVRLQVTPVGAEQAPPMAQAGGAVVVAPAMQQQPVVISAPTPAVVYQAYPYGYPSGYAYDYPYGYGYGYPAYRPYFPVGVAIGLGFGGYGYRGGHFHGGGGRGGRGR